MFYQIIARYFEKFRDIAPVEVGNVIRVEIVNYLLVHQNWIQVRKFEVRNASKLYIVFLFFFFFAKYQLFSQYKLVTSCVLYLFITALDKVLFGCSRDINIDIHEQSSETDNRQN